MSPPSKMGTEQFKAPRKGASSQTIKLEATSGHLAAVAPRGQRRYYANSHGGIAHINCGDLDKILYTRRGQQVDVFFKCYSRIDNANYLAAFQRHQMLTPAEEKEPGQQEAKDFVAQHIPGKLTRQAAVQLTQQTRYMTSSGPGSMQLNTNAALIGQPGTNLQHQPKVSETVHNVSKPQPAPNEWTQDKMSSRDKQLHRPLTAWSLQGHAQSATGAAVKEEVNRQFGEEAEPRIIAVLKQTQSIPNIVATRKDEATYSQAYHTKAGVPFLIRGSPDATADNHEHAIEVKARMSQQTVSKHEDITGHDELQLLGYAMFPEVKKVTLVQGLEQNGSFSEADVTKMVYLDYSQDCGKHKNRESCVLKKFSQVQKVRWETVVLPAVRAFVTVLDSVMCDISLQDELLSLARVEQVVWLSRRIDAAKVHE